MSEEEQNTIYWKELREGSREALFSLYSNNYFHLVRFGLKITANDELVKECVSKLFFQLWDRHRKLNEVKQVRPYLFTAFRRMLLDLLEHRSRTDMAIASFSKEDPEEELSYEEIIIRVQGDEELRLKLHRAIAQLTPRQTELIRLMFFEGMTYEQVAAHTSQSIKTAYNTIYNAISQLRKILK